MEVSPEYIEKFDKLFEQYMFDFAGPNWRTMCHQSAKIASKSLQLLFPQIKIKMRRVEVIAWMEGGKSFVHLGWLEDPEKIEGKMPAHFAVEIGKGLYDPTFYQLRLCKTPLDLPDEPYFYYPKFKDLIKDSNGFRWFHGDRPSGILHIAYMFQDVPLPKEELEKLLSDKEAKHHGQKVADLCKKIRFSYPLIKN
jgi:hypothetical protein